MVMVPASCGSGDLNGVLPGNLFSRAQVYAAVADHDETNDGRNRKPVGGQCDIDRHCVGATVTGQQPILTDRFDVREEFVDAAQ